ncbi:MAG: TatD family hydrolase [Syntrophorhabdaceae bacterium]|nr:TatD family hydrolase [Syntrophorhabdaceae bacterium]
MFVDSHCHLEMEDFHKDLEQVVKDCVDEGLEYILTVGTEESYFGRVRELIDRYPFIYGAIGIHPHNAKDFDDRVEGVIRQAARHPKIVGYGEVGLDLFKNHSPREVQKRVFVRQLALAQELGLPIIVHSREAKKETLDILKSEYPGGYGVIHCYSYDLAAAKEFLDMGFFISIPGTVTYKTAGGLRDVVRFIPADRLLAETDAPFLTPVPHRGKRNVPAYVKITIEAIARERRMEAGELAALMRDNFVTLFLKDPQKDRS